MPSSAAILRQRINGVQFSRRCGAKPLQQLTMRSATRERSTATFVETVPGQQAPFHTDRFRWLRRGDVCKGLSFFAGPRAGRPAFLSTFRAGAQEEQDVVELACLSSDKLKDLATKYTRQDNAHSAQKVIDILIVKGESNILSTLSTQVLDMWQRIQSRNLQSAKNDELARPMPLIKEMIRVAEAATLILENTSSPSIHHRTSVLTAWASIVEAAKFRGIARNHAVRGVPQRMQHILGPESYSPENYNLILKAWAMSGEPLRGTMAGEVFTKIEYPNSESFRWAIRAFCWSGEGDGAFNATRLFMRMMKLLEHRRDLAPTVEDYRTVLEAWSTAK
jgi:hypothetical protein